MYVSDRMLWLSDKRSRIQGYIYYNQYLISTGQPEKNTNLFYNISNCNAYEEK